MDTELIRLAELCESADIGTRYLDALLEIQLRRCQAYALGMSDQHRAHWKPIGAAGEVHDGHVRYHPPLYSQSYDAAMKLMPAGWFWNINEKPISVRVWTEGNAALWSPPAGSKSSPSNPILSLCAAAIYAQAYVLEQRR